MRTIRREEEEEEQQQLDSLSHYVTGSYFKTLYIDKHTPFEGSRKINSYAEARKKIRLDYS
jgi:hypothetical protein